MMVADKKIMGEDGELAGKMSMAVEVEFTWRDDQGD